MKVIKSGTNYGRINVNLSKEVDKRGETIYSLSKKSGVKYDIVKNYYYGYNYSYNLDTLARFCYVLECDIKDILEYTCEEDIYS